MEIYPTRYSLLSASALNDYIQKQYGFKDTSCRLLIHNVSDVYLIENKESKYIFKIYRNAHRTIDEIQGELELLKILKEQGAKISYPIPDLSCNYIQSLNAAEGNKNGVLFSFAPGKVITELNELHIEIIGREMAKIHNIVSTIQLTKKRKTYDVNSLIINPIQIIKLAFETLPEEYEYLKSAGEKIAEKLNGFDDTQFSYGICHFDFLPKNFHFDENNQITFFDFDFAGYGMLANDIASFYVYFFIEVYMQKGMSQEKADELFAVFVNAYREVRDLTKTELNAIPYLGFAFWVFYLGFQYENFEDWSNMFFGPNFLKGRVALIKTYVEWHCKV